MWPWLIGGAIALYLYNKNKSDSGSEVTASNGTSVTLPGLAVPQNLQPLTSDDVSVARAVLDGSFIPEGTSLRLDQQSGAATAAQRLSILQTLFNEWGEVGRSDRVPDLRTVLSLG